MVPFFDHDHDLDLDLFRIIIFTFLTIFFVIMTQMTNNQFDSQMTAEGTVVAPTCLSCFTFYIYSLEFQSFLGKWSDSHAETDIVDYDTFQAC